MTGEHTTGPTNQASIHKALIMLLRYPLSAALCAVLLITLLYQIPVVHSVDLGGYDSAYTLGFYGPERTAAAQAAPELQGSDGSARWSHTDSFLLFPQAGLPAQLQLHLRSHAEQTPVTILVNGATPTQFQLGTAWHTITIPITAGLTKPEDLLITIHSTTGILNTQDPRQVGVLIDRATLTVGPPLILPSPAQLIYAAIAAGLLWILLNAITNVNIINQIVSSGQSYLQALIAVGISVDVQMRWKVTRFWAIGMALIALAFLFLYRMQPPYPMPLRGFFPTTCIALAIAVALVYQKALQQLRWLPILLAWLAMFAWLVMILFVAEQHLVLSVPGVEKDFRVFATRDTLATIFHADGFYNIGYPLILWLIKPFTNGNAFLAARLIAACSGLLLLMACWLLARLWLDRWSALLALVLLALSPFTIEYALYIGSDLPFAASSGLALALLGLALRHKLQLWRWLLAGAVAGSAFLFRHPGMVLLVLGWLAIGLELALRWPVSKQIWRPTLRKWLAYTIAFLLAILPQVIINLHDTGQPFYSQQSKNIWLAVFGNGDWGRWGEVSNDITLSEVILQDPSQFMLNLNNNLRAFIGTGAEDTTEFGRAIQLHLLGFPANWLAIAGLLGLLGVYLALASQTIRAKRLSLLRKLALANPLLPLLLFGWILLYTLLIVIGFALPRFFLPLTLVYAIFASWALKQIGRIIQRPKLQLLLTILLCWFCWSQATIGANYVIRSVAVGEDRPGQPALTLQLAQLIQNQIKPGETILAHIPNDDEAGLALLKYSAISQLVLAPPAEYTPATITATGASFLIWADRYGPPPIGTPIEQVGPYLLLRL